ncbi:MAG: hypothetical protein R3F61_34445 [Myxococcota bacterium]
MLLPASPRDWLSENHLAFFVLSVAHMLDLGAIEGAIHSKDPRGQRPYSPRTMVGLLVRIQQWDVLLAAHRVGGTGTGTGTGTAFGWAREESATQCATGS